MEPSTVLYLASLKMDIAKSVDPDQMPHNVASDQSQHCLHLGQKLLQNMVTIKTNQTFLKLKWTGPKW